MESVSPFSPLPSLDMLNRDGHDQSVLFESTCCLNQRLPRRSNANRVTIHLVIRCRQEMMWRLGMSASAGYRSPTVDGSEKGYAKYIEYTYTRINSISFGQNRVHKARSSKFSF